MLDKIKENMNELKGKTEKNFEELQRHNQLMEEFAENISNDLHDLTCTLKKIEGLIRQRI